MSLATTIVGALVLPLLLFIALGHWWDIHHPPITHRYTLLGLLTGLTVSGVLLWYIESHWRNDD